MIATWSDSDESQIEEEKVAANLCYMERYVNTEVKERNMIDEHNYNDKIEEFEAITFMDIDFALPIYNKEKS
ncbi:Uncharacterized protein TCM_013691 [Theobroma cacao]|uniref:Uncharacterized protein n=1 Tax=Theobroma cacao TaxID=3641 RepID=A0A061G3U7_THECC|nr:Uncharacterized protein TCM_013691 [Theobroma cacao]